MTPNILIYSLEEQGLYIHFIPTRRF